MEFWSVVVKPGKAQKIDVSDGMTLRLTQVALTYAPGSSRSSLRDRAQYFPFLRNVGQGELCERESTTHAAGIASHARMIVLACSFMSSRGLPLSCGCPTLPLGAAGVERR